jgi:hypothetical protein
MSVLAALRAARTLACTLICGAVLTTSLQAQNALLPLDDIAYTYIDALQARGLLRELPLIERPYAVGAVRAALSTARAQHPDAGTSRWLTAIERAADKYAPGVTAADSGVFVAGLAGNTVAQTSGARDLMQPNRRGAVLPGFAVRALVQSGPFTAAMRVLGDRRMKADPDFFGRKDRIFSTRTEEAYIGVSSKFAILEAGRVNRSWGLPGQLGQTVSNAAYSYDHAYLRLGTDKLHISSIIAKLDDELLNFATDTFAPRFFSAHRLAVKLKSFEAGVTESIVYGGKGQGFAPSLSNPFAPIFLTQYSDAEEINVAFGADAVWRAPRGMLFGAQIYVDDFQIDRCGELCGEPPGIGLTATADGLPLVGGARGFASYTRVNALTYRTPDRVERYTYRLVGLGQRNSDFDEVRAGVDVGPALPTPLRVYLAYRRQGAGDYRSPYPSLTERGRWPTIFEGVVINTLRIAASGALRVGTMFEITGDAGVNRSRNDGRVRGATSTRFEGRVRVAIEPEWGRVRMGLF